MDFKDLDVYKIAMQLGEFTWELVIKWNYFEKSTIGKQWTEAADSVAANISEGEGRYTYPDRKRFYYISRGSLNETETWMSKSFNRKLITLEQRNEYLDMVNECRKQINICVLNLKRKIA